MAEEFRFHVEMETERLVRESGLLPAEARRRALIAFGSVEEHKEELRGDRGAAWLGHDIIRDVRAAWRSLWRTPTFTITTCVILAIGIGTNAAVLGVIDAAFFRPLPVPQPSSIIAIFSTQGHGSHRAARLEPNSFADYAAIRQPVRGIEGLAAYRMASLTFEDAAGGANLWAALVSGTYFGVLHVDAQRGRVIREDDERMGSAGLAVVISDAMWKERFGASDTAIGTRVLIERRPYIIVGVAPKGFTGTHPEGRTDLWVPYSSGVMISGSAVNLENHAARVAAIIGRLRPGATLSQAQASLDNLSREFRIRFPESDSTLGLVAVHHARLVIPEESPGALTSFLLVWMMVLLVHLVACSNVAMLVVARAAAKRHELGIRLCLGASRGRIIWQSLVESGILALLGAIGGTVLAQWMIQLVTRMQFLSAFNIGLDWRILAIVVSVTVLTALQFGLWPARSAAREDPLVLLGGTSGGRVKGGRDRSVSVILVAQVAVCLVLCANAAFVVHGFQVQTTTDPGFDLRHVLVASIRPNRTTSSDWLSAHDQALERARAMPGVLQASSAVGAPLYHAAEPQRIAIPGRVRAAEEQMTFLAQRVGPGYFSTLGVSMASGREFTTSDRGSGKADEFDVVVINQLLARRLWPAGDAVGQLIGLERGAPARVIGIAADVLDVSASAAQPRLYLPLLESRRGPFEILMRINGDPKSMTSVIRAALSSSSSAPVQVTTMTDIHDGATSLARVAGLGLTACSAIALLLVSIGLYGTVSGWVSTRKSEIGVRLALGAPASHVHALVLGSVFRLLAMGGVLGLLASVGLARIERSWLGPFFSFEPLPIVVAIIPLVLSAGIAAFIPSLRAVKTNPATVLRGN